MNSKDSRKLMFEKIAAGFPVRSLSQLKGVAGKLKGIPWLEELFARGGGKAGTEALSLSGKAIDDIPKLMRSELSPDIAKVLESAPSDLSAAINAPSGTYSRPAALGATVGGAGGALTDISEEKENPMFGTTRTTPGSWRDRLRNVASGALLGAGVGVGMRANKFQGSQNPIIQKALEHGAGDISKAIGSIKDPDFLALARDLPNSAWERAALALKGHTAPGGALHGELNGQLMSSKEIQDTVKNIASHQLRPEFGNLSGKPTGWINYSPNTVHNSRRLLDRSALMDQLTKTDALLADPELAAMVGISGPTTRRGFLGIRRTAQNPADVLPKIEEMLGKMQTGKVPANDRLYAAMMDAPARIKAEDMARAANDKLMSLFRLPEFMRNRSPEVTRYIQDIISSAPGIENSIAAGTIGPELKRLNETLRRLTGADITNFVR